MDKDYKVTLLLPNRQVLELASFGTGPKDAVLKLLRSNGAGSISHMTASEVEPQKIDSSRLPCFGCYAKVTSTQKEKFKYYYVETEADLTTGSWTSLT
jgi:hypothetical protein